MFEEEFDLENRIVSTAYTPEDADTDTGLCPKTLRPFKKGSIKTFG